ncbi:Sec1-like protein [Aulographum hederae CBS 113979]|uniref:Sec1-like protein n=1 Tax=Aulographum hederae CBS 113979 TaxID=1176131 RepID=A0A6G1H939_9PEZI|nr:Sec1-like protein [Aulographum hederae CBS 113979]
MAPLVSINPADLAEKARRDILQLLEGVRGKKNLVIQKSLSGPLSLFVKFSTLQEYGVDKVFFLENDNVDTSQKNVVFLARGEKAHNIYAMAEQIKRVRRDSQTEHDFSVFWVPRRTLVSDQILEESGVLGEASILEYSLYFVPLAEDVLSLEYNDAFSDLYLRKDPSSIFLSAKALMTLQEKHGLFPRITGKGDNAKRLADLLLRMRSEVSAGDDMMSSGNSILGLTPSASIESLIIVDRKVDFPTALLTQLTYEGLIDEVFGIQSNQTEIDSSIIGAAAPQSSQASSSTAPSGPQSRMRKIQLDNSDSLYTTLRDSNFAIVGPLLNKVARRLQTTYESRHTAAKTTAELRDFVSKLPGYQNEQASLKLHTNLAEEIIKHTRSDIFSRVLEVQQNMAAGADPATQHDNIDELIARDVPLRSILRLLCLESTLSNGIKQKDLDIFKRAIVHAYGAQHLLTLSALEKMGLLTVRSGGLASINPTARGQAANTYTNYQTARKNLALIFDEVNESEPDDIAYVFSGYAPLSVRIVQCILQKQKITSLSSQRGGTPTAGTTNATTGWKPFEDTVRQIRGATFDEVQKGEEKAVKARQILSGSAHGAEKTVVVFFLGGVTRAEIAALRFVGQQMKEEGKGRKILICTTGIVNGDGVIGAAIEEKGFGGK